MRWPLWCRFYSEWLRLALRRTFDFTDAGMLFLSAIILGLVPYLMGYEIIINAPWWAITLMVMGFVFLLRFFLAPYWMYKELQSKIKPPGISNEVAQELASLVSEGGNIHAMAVTNSLELTEFDRLYLNWSDRVTSFLENNYSKAKAIAIMSLGRFTLGSYRNVFNEYHRQKKTEVGIIHSRLKQLLELAADNDV
jgi:hypothetical protein